MVSSAGNGIDCLPSKPSLGSYSGGTNGLLALRDTLTLGRGDARPAGVSRQRGWVGLHTWDAGNVTFPTTAISVALEVCLPVHPHKME